MFTQNRDEEVRLIAAISSGKKPLCPKCEQAHLEPLHKKAKKSNMDCACPSCKERYQIEHMIDDINGRGRDTKRALPRKAYRKPKNAKD